MEKLFKRLEAFSGENPVLFEKFIIESGSEFGIFPLSFSQTRLWFIDQLQPGSPLYNIPAALHTRGNLDCGALQKSINTIIERHEILRTVFKEINGYPVQVVLPEARFQLETTDLRECRAAEREAESAALIRKVSRQSFNLAAGPLFRGLLIRITDDESFLVLVWHHIIIDGWSLNIFVGELSALYNSHVNGKAVILPEIPVQYADFAAWQRKSAETDEFAKQLAYWKEQLGPPLPVLDLPLDKPRPAVQGFSGARYPVGIGRELTARLKQLSRDEECTLFMVILASLNVLLYRYTGQEEILLGSPVAGRPSGETEHLVGFFVNNLVFRTRFSAGCTFAQLLKIVKQTVIDGFAHQDIPFEKIVEEIQPGRSMSHTPLFQVMVAWQNTPLPGLALQDLKVTFADMDYRISKFDLTWDLREEADGIKGYLEFNTDLFNPGTMHRLLLHWQTLLEALAAGPGTEISALQMLSAGEWDRLLAGWNDTAAAYPPDQSVLALFEACAAERPGSTALIYAGEKITYAELNRKANRLARYLLKQGAGPGTLAAVCIDNCPDMYYSIIGVLKTGSAYLAVDPSYPPGRIQHMLCDSAAPLLLTHESLYGQPGGCLQTGGTGSARVICLDRVWDEIDREADGNLPLAYNPDNRAYVIYTSGSTGQPKGVAVRHRGLANLVQWHIREFAVTCSDKTTQTAQFGFDACVWEIWPYLAAGSTIELLPAHLRHDPEGLQQWLSAREITICFLATPLAAKIMELPWPGQAKLRILLTGGDKLTVYPGEKLPFTLVNNYGPTEYSVVATSTVIRPCGKSAVLPPSIGRPIANTRVYVLDSCLNPVPAGVPGELFIGGAGLAEGYINNPGLTAQKFIKDPFNKAENSLLYRTGDLVRYSEDGALHFIARMDNQVKIRGFRIELGEIESVLLAHGEIKSAVVTVRQNGEQTAGQKEEGNKQLVAYIIPRRKDAFQKGNNGLRDFLKNQLPGYMLPAAFIFLDQFPLTPNGKIDYKALPAPDRNMFAGEQDYAAPSTSTEEMLASIWSEVLQVSPVSSSANFFALGGHSLLATQVFSRIRNLFKIELPLQTLFTTETLSALAKCIDLKKAQADEELTPPVLPVPRNGKLPLSFSQKRLWFLDKFMPGITAYNMGIGVYIRGKPDPGLLTRSLNAVIERHEILRTVFLPDKDELSLVIKPSLELAVPVSDLRSLPEDKRAQEALRISTAESQLAFNLEQGPLIRAKLLQLETDLLLLVVVKHHIISDGWSLNLFFREMIAVYAALQAGTSSPLPALPVQFADYAGWQQHWLQGRVLDKQLVYWKQKLHTPLPVIELPADNPRPPLQSYKGAHFPVTIPQDLVKALLVFSRENDVTLFMLLLAVFKIMLYRYTGLTDIIVGTSIAGRSQEQLERLIGFFVNTLVLRTEFAADWSFGALLKAVRNVTLEAYTHQEIPFEKLVEELKPGRDLSHTPLFQIFFTLQNARFPAMESAGLILEPFLIDNKTAKFDLALNLEEKQDSISGFFEYNTDLFVSSTIERMFNHYLTLLKAAILAPQTAVSRLPMLTAGEKELLLDDWNRTGMDYPRDKCLHQLFEDQALRNPGAVSLLFDGKTLTYGELNVKANRLAHYLVKKGAGPGMIIGICLERSPEMVAGLLAVLKTGAAYLPLDPAQPPGRLSFTVADARVPLLLSKGRLADRVTDFTGEVVALDTLESVLAGESAENPGRDTTPANPAYVIYTSGSTGTPKGVVIQHKALVNFLSSMQKSPGCTAGDVLLSVTTLIFDIAGLELYLPLVSGAAIALAGFEDIMDGKRLAALLEKTGATIMQATPATWRLLLESGWSGGKHLKVLCGGEAFPEDLAGQLLEKCGQVWNMYGPTETTIWSTIHRVTGADRQIPIGKPIGNTKIYILDQYMNPVPAGVPGLLYIGGDGLAQGYLYREKLTAERFVPDPFCAKQGCRLYNTGDLAFYRPDGTVQYAGRSDHQVKIHGFRIELGEIESVLAGYPGIQQVAAVVREDLPGDKRIAAYLVPGKTAPAVSSLREHLKTKLPDYMLPSCYVMLDKLPLTPNGKIDRRQLPAPEKQRPELGAAYVAPQSQWERIIAEIWLNLLPVEKVGVHDNFFELGGHSLLMANMQNRLQEKLPDKTISIVELFQYPTIHSLAKYISTKAQPEFNAQQARVKVRTDRKTDMEQQRKSRMLSRLQ